MRMPAFSSWTPRVWATLFVRCFDFSNHSLTLLPTFALFAFRIAKIIRPNFHWLCWLDEREREKRQPNVSLWMCVCANAYVQQIQCTRLSVAGCWSMCVCVWASARARVLDANLNVENRIICVHNDSTNKIDDELIGFALFATNRPTNRPGPFNQMNSIYMCVHRWMGI